MGAYDEDYRRSLEDPEGFWLEAAEAISWTAPPSHADDAVYRVVRRTDRGPRDADDGTVVADVAGARFTTDPAPPVGRGHSSSRTWDLAQRPCSTE